MVERPENAEVQGWIREGAGSGEARQVSLQPGGARGPAREWMGGAPCLQAMLNSVVLSARSVLISRMGG